MEGTNGGHDSLFQPMIIDNLLETWDLVVKWVREEGSYIKGELQGNRDDYKTIWIQLGWTPKPKLFITETRLKVPFSTQAFPLPSYTTYDELFT